ncbi:MAG: aminoacyl-histidine dipeptidase [Lachnospiraceae bacterium]|nr:aminoacyl-histidine dipeptidase [Lachnospiraceae bacterium]
MNVLKGLEPKEVLEIFEEISKIPRGSSNEKAISDYIADIAKTEGFFVYQDEAHNVVVKKNGTEGYENSEPVILQGHIDMVCEKNANVTHDFMKDPIKLKIDGDFITADGTTLGADNGIAVAYMLAVLKSKTLAHPPIEAVFTSDEEAGMNGARKLDYSILKGRQLINLDSEEEGHILTCCAGGLRAKISVPVVWELQREGQTAFKITVKGLKGGHSGSDIHLQRANANKLLGRLLNGLLEEANIKITEINGGNMDNAIPREAETVISCGDKDCGIVEGLCQAFNEMCTKEYRGIEEGILVTVEKLETVPKRVFSVVTAQRAIAVLMLIPYGVKAFSVDIEGLVESSNNIGIVRTSHDKITFTCATRSSVATRKQLICDEMKTIAMLTGAEFSTRFPYPAWEYNPNSRLREVLSNTYRNMFGKEAKIDAIHAGLECGIFSENLEGCDMVSIGPEMADVHTPDERLSISSTKHTWDYLKEILKNLR